MPSSIPTPSLSGYGWSHLSSFARTDMDSGIARQRRRFLSTPATAQVSWRLNRQQLADFESFVRNSLYGGVAWFTTRLPTPSGMASVRARFTEPHRISGTDSPSIFDVSATIETLSI